MNDVSFERTVSICGQRWNRPEIAEVPILLAVNKCAVGQGNEIRRIGNADFIITPFTEKNLRDEISTTLGH